MGYLFNSVADELRNLERDLLKFKFPFSNDKDLEQREFVVEKNGIKTIITARFNKQGKLMYLDYEASYQPSEDEIKLNDLMTKEKEAVAKRDYVTASKIKDEIDKIKTKK